MSVVKRSFYRAVAVAAVVSLCALPLYAQGDRVCSVKSIMGSVKVLTARDRTANPADVKTWPDARLGQTLRENDRIATLGESEVRLETADGSTIRLRENTVLEMATLKGGAAPHTRIRLHDGSVVTNVKKLADGRSRFEFETPTAVAAIRGTNVEIDSRSKHGTTVKTFDGSLEIGASKVKKGGRQNVGNYEMVEIPSSQRAANKRRIPSHYRAKSTKILSEEDVANLTGFRRVILTYGELEEIVEQFARDGIVAAVGVGVANSEMDARKLSADVARTELAKSMDVQVQRLSESYTQNVGGQAATIWEEGVRQLTNVSVRGSNVHTTITQYNMKTGMFRVYSLMKIEPDRFKNVFLAETGRQEEAGLRVRKDELTSRMDSAIKAYNTRYHDR